jgi:hypothetical protein
VPCSVPAQYDRVAWDSSQESLGGTWDIPEFGLAK